MRKIKEPNYLIPYFISILITILLNYFFLVPLKIHPTVQILIAFIIFTLIMGILVKIIESCS